jgi:glycosyltransferase involved in cell wall biosynthesis
MSQRKDISDVVVDIVIPVLNEAHVLEASTSRVRGFLEENVKFKWQIVIADNGSTDGTLEVARSLAARFGDVRCEHLNVKGRGRALRETWSKSKADIVTYMDVDLSTELAALPKLVDALVGEGYDIAVGSRLAKGAVTKRCWKREVTSRAYNAILKCVLFVGFSDAQCGFKALSRLVVDRLVPQVRDQSWFFDTELLVLAERQGYRIKDLPVKWIEDDDSRVKIVPTAWNDLKGVFRLRWKFLQDRWGRPRKRSGMETQRSAGRELL